MPHCPVDSPACRIALLEISIASNHVHSPLTLCMTRQMVQRDSLCKVESLLVEHLPVPVPRQPMYIILPIAIPKTVSIPSRKENSHIQLQIMLHIDRIIRLGRHAPERCPQLLIMYPNLHILPIKEHLQPTSMINMQMPNHHLLNILNLISCRLNRLGQLMLRLIAYPRENVRDLRPHVLRELVAAARLPQDQTLVRMVDQHAVHWHLAAFVNEGFVLFGEGGGVLATDHEGGVGFEPAHFEDVHLGALGAGLEVGGDGAGGDGGLESCHSGGGGGGCWLPGFAAAALPKVAIFCYRGVVCNVKVSQQCLTVAEEGYREREVGKKIGSTRPSHLCLERFQAYLANLLELSDTSFLSLTPRLELSSRATSASLRQP